MSWLGSLAVGLLVGAAVGAFLAHWFGRRRRAPELRLIEARQAAEKRALHLEQLKRLQAIRREYEDQRAALQARIHAEADRLALDTASRHALLAEILRGDQANDRLS